MEFWCRIMDVSYFHKIFYMTRGEERPGTDTENSEKSAATTPANHIDIVYFNENSLKNKIIQNFTEKGVGAVYLANP